MNSTLAELSSESSLNVFMHRLYIAAFIHISEQQHLHTANYSTGSTINTPAVHILLIRGNTSPGKLLQS